MTNNEFKKGDVEVQAGAVKICRCDDHSEMGQATVEITFSDGTVLTASYWRLVKDGQAAMSSFDDKQKYGLPAPLDAVGELEKLLSDTSFIAMTIDSETGDLLLDFANRSKLQIFNFTGYEVWIVSFPDGTEMYSTYC